MYQRDVNKIKTYVETKGPDGMLDVCSFVLTTIRVPFVRVGDMMDEIRVQGSQSSHLWGWKRSGYLQCQEHKNALYDALIASPMPLDDALDYMSSFRGFGLPKAAFVLQLVGYDTGCLDSHNLKRFNLKAADFKPAKKNRAKVIDRYINVTQTHGAEFLWDSWCNFVAGNGKNKQLSSGDQVSALHYTAIAGA